MEKFVTRAFNKMEANENTGVLRKISKTDRLKNEINYYRNLPRTLEGFFPRLMEYNLDNTNGDYYMDLELYSYSNLGEFIFDKEFVVDWSVIFKKIHYILDIFKKHTPDVLLWDNSFSRKTSIDMYITKTESEYVKFVNGWSKIFPNLFTNNPLFINGQECINFHVIWPSVKDYILNNMLDYTPTAIHGDCCFSNILYGYDKGVIRFIDPRGSFGTVGIWGDNRYDIAKLYHSAYGAYETIINDRFDISSTTDAFKLLDECSEIKSAFEQEFFGQYNKKEILILTGTIFIGMCARHFDSESRQKIMYLTGVKMLNEAMAL